MMMRALSVPEVLDIWEGGSRKTPSARALELLAAVRPETSRESLESLSIGQRDAMLLELRERLFGPQVAAVVICPRCQERLDLAFNVPEIHPAARDAAREVSLNVRSYALRLRLVNVADAIAASAETDLEESTRLIIQRCLVSANREGISVDAGEIPLDVAEIAVQRVAEADPMAEIQLAMTCPSCDLRWCATMDIASFLWTEIDAWAWRTLGDVHTLASAYGWSERQVLELSPSRRQCYLQMVRA